MGCYLEKWYLNLCCFLFRVLNFQLADAIHAKVVWVVHMGCILHQSYYWKTEGNTKDILSHYKYTLTPTYISFIFRGGVFFSRGDNVYVIMDPAGIACSFDNSAK